MTAPTLTIDTESEPGAWASALRYPPFQETGLDTWTNGFTPAGQSSGSRARHCTTQAGRTSFVRFKKGES